LLLDVSDFKRLRGHIASIKTHLRSMRTLIQANLDPYHGSLGLSAYSAQKTKPHDNVELVQGPSLHPEPLAAARDTFANTSVQQMDVKVFHEPRKDPPVKPGQGAQRGELLEYIKQQLDCYGKEPLLMNCYQLLGPDQRAAGGAFSLSCMNTSSLSIFCTFGTSLHGMCPVSGCS
jgi:hypothetical protein